MIELRGYQSRAIGDARSALAREIRRLMIAAPTGSGKTEIGMEIIRGVVRKQKRAAFLCNRIHLVQQTSRRFFRAGIEHGVIQGANTVRAYANVLVASISTVAGRGLPKPDLLLIDEAHGVAGSAEYRKVIEMYSDVPLIGLSATPWAKGLGKHYDTLHGPLFEEMIVAATIGELIEQGYLVDVEVYAPSQPDLSNVKIVAGDYHEGQLAEAVNKPTLVGDIVAHWKRLAHGLPTVCFATDIAHSKHITEQFNAHGVACEHIDFRTEDAERQEILARVAAGRTKVISNVGILTEGWDFPACRCLILARPTKSLIRYVQMGGRVLRPVYAAGMPISTDEERRAAIASSDKPFALILDHAGVTEKLGFVTEECPMRLDDGKPNESKARDEEKEKLPKKCPSCHYMKPYGVHTCPRCSFAPERRDQVEVKDGELRKLDRKPKRVVDQIAALGKQEVYSQLLGIVDDRGYRDGWAANKYRDVFGVWPRGVDRVATEPSYELHQWVRSQQIKYAKSSKGEVRA